MEDATNLLLKNSHLYAGRLVVIAFDMMDPFIRNVAEFFGINKYKVDPPVMRLIKIKDKMVHRFDPQITQINLKSFETFFTRYPGATLVPEIKSLDYIPIALQEARIKTLTAKTLEEAIFGSEKPVLVLFYLKTCPISEKFLVLLDQLTTKKKKINDSIIFTKFDVEKNELEHFTFTEFPMLVMFIGNFSPLIFEGEIESREVEKWIARTLEEKKMRIEELKEKEWVFEEESEEEEIEDSLTRRYDL